MDSAYSHYALKFFAGPDFVFVLLSMLQIICVQRLPMTLTCILQYLNVVLAGSWQCVRAVLGISDLCYPPALLVPTTVDNQYTVGGLDFSYHP